MRQVAAVLPRGEGKVQHLHARVAAALLQGLHRGGQVAQVLGNDGRAGHGVVNGLDKVVPWPLDPFAAPGGLVPIGNGPVALKAPEMVDAQHVEHGELGLHAADPPGEAVLGHFVPAVDGVAPELAVGGEGVRRAPGHLNGHIVLVQLELAGVGPHVRAVAGDVDGHVANDGDPFFVGVLFQFSPLLEE